MIYPAIPNISFKKKGKMTKFSPACLSWFQRRKANLAAFNALVKKYDIELIMRIDASKGFIKKYAGLKGVTFVPRLPSRESVMQLYKRADIFVMPSATEGFGYVYLEAMNFCLPVVALKLHSAVREIVDDQRTGYLVEPEIEIYNPDYSQRW